MNDRKGDATDAVDGKAKKYNKQSLPVRAAFLEEVCRYHSESGNMASKKLSTNPKILQFPYFSEPHSEESTAVASISSECGRTGGSIVDHPYYGEFYISDQFCACGDGFHRL